MILLRIFKFFLKFIIGCLLLGIVIVIAGYGYYSKDLPDVATLKDVRLQTPLQILTKEGDLIAFFGERRRFPLTYQQIPEKVIKAIIATEDSRFYEHYGVDPIGISRALFIGLTGHVFSQGGSTITQQVAKNFFLTPEKSISRKVKEMILAFRIEKELTKGEIITLYLNMINFGSRAYGIEAASYTFFGKTVDQLTIEEVALLAGLPNAPSAYNPISHPKKALIRRNWVLHRMLEQSYINQSEYNQAITKPLNVKYHAPKIAVSAPYVAEMARQFMYDKFGENAYSEGYKVYTTISKQDQIAANEAIEKNILDYDMHHGYRGAQKILWHPNDDRWDLDEIAKTLKQIPCYKNMCPAAVILSNNLNAKAVLKDRSTITISYENMKWARRFINDNQQGSYPTKVSDIIKSGQLIWVKKVKDHWTLTQLPEVNASLVSLNSDNGAINALVGGYDFNLSKFNRATQAIRQFGSNIKPFIYTATLDKGYTLATLINDAPIVRWAGTETWRPKNSPPIYDGLLRLRLGLVLSKNVMAVRALRAIGINDAVSYLARFGFPKENIPHNESLALGAASFTPLQAARAYSVINNGGFLITPYLIEKIESNDQVVYEHKAEIICRNCNNNVEKMRSILNNDVENTANGSEDSEELISTNMKADDFLVLPTLDSDDKANYSQISYAPQTISPDVAFLMKSTLKSIIFGEKNWRGTAWRSRVLNRNDIGGKTGTTNDAKDAWFSGFAANNVTTVWIGFDDYRRQLGKSQQAEGGAVTANPIWVDYMQIAVKDIPEQEEAIPENIIQVMIDPKSGLLSKDESTGMNEYFIKGTEPKHFATKEIDTEVTDSQGNTSELF